MKNKIIFIVGPTAAGKTELAIKLAKRIGGEIISCDSMQVYKGLDILSAKPSIAQRRQIKHHLIDIISPAHNFNVSKFIKLSTKLIDEIHSRSKIPIFVGGTGLYIGSLLNGLFKGPATNTKLRSSLYKLAEKYGGSYLYRRLNRVDPESAKKIHPNDIRKMVRALEVYKITKKSISQLKGHRKGLLNNNRFDIHIFGIKMERDKLYELINKRADKMFALGAVREVKEILKNRCSKTFKQALGIKEINSYLNGEISLDKAKNLLKRNTRRYAKRQITWFRKDEKIVWLETALHKVRSGLLITEILQKIKVFSAVC